MQRLPQLPPSLFRYSLVLPCLLLAGALLSSALLPSAVRAQALPIRPGLWEHQVQLQTPSGRIEGALALAKTQLELLPPQQRQLLEATLRAQGIDPDWLDQRFRTCITTDDIAAGLLRFAEQGGCTLGQVRPDGIQTHVDFRCTEGEGQGSVTLTGDNAYTGQSHMLLQFAGIEEAATATHSGRWLDAQCPAAQ